MFQMRHLLCFNTKSLFLPCLITKVVNLKCNPNIFPPLCPAPPAVSVSCVQRPDGAPTMLCDSKGFYPADLKQV